MDDRARKEAGRAGEAAALEHLQRAGLQLVLRNFRCKGEYKQFQENSADARG